MQNEILKKIRSEMVTDDDYMTAFRNNVRLFLNNGLTLRELSEKADISIETLKSFIYGNATDCRLGLAVKIATALDVSIDALVGLDFAHIGKYIAMLDKMPTQFLKFIKWAISHNYERMMSCPSGHPVNVMVADFDKNMIATTDFVVVDIDAPSEIVGKTIFGIRIPCDDYAPTYYQDDIVLVSDDRLPRNGDHLIVHIDNSFWIVRKDKDNHRVLKNNRINNNGEYIGYISYVHREEEKNDN